MFYSEMFCPWNLPGPVQGPLKPDQYLRADSWRRWSSHLSGGRVTWAAERLLGCDAPVAGGAQGGGGHRQGGEQVAVAVARLPLSRLLLSLLQTLLLLILHRETGEGQTGQLFCK